MRYLSLLFLILSTGFATAQSVDPRDGWVVMETDKPFETLLEDLSSAVSDEGFAVVTQAGPTGAARSRGIEIPENRVVGVFNNIYAVRILGLSTAAMIEAPVRFYLTEDEDGTATLSYKTPGFVFAPYMEEGGPDLAAAAAELDTSFLAIANAAVR
ncbi:DUF302 domain-containing protein [Rhodophyticola sp. CCM32]|uniref:DUF302 domain-containing protein n=1 Tax=Rhodophyticola sp. CCM32 TaxID=2916397 RepID=UPI00107F2A10|nr:DUF302 domain-containing protein [Rhodophyticola sp. CCM32]QBY01014.1 DUF302 domain-containing protein [Rhodophyticola sp. CCM32]